jgi:hypothetical protein
MKCPECDGTGRTERDPSGVFALECPDCGGIGSLPEPVNGAEFMPAYLISLDPDTEPVSREISPGVWQTTWPVKIEPAEAGGTGAREGGET